MDGGEPPAVRWPSEHTLWPFELLLYGPVALAYILIVRYRRVNVVEKRERSLR